MFFVTPTLRLLRLGHYAVLYLYHSSWLAQRG